MTLYLEKKKFPTTSFTILIILIFPSQLVIKNTDNTVQQQEKHDGKIPEDS